MIVVDIFVWIIAIFSAEFQQKCYEYSGFQIWKQHFWPFDTTNRLRSEIFNRYIYKIKNSDDWFLGFEVTGIEVTPWRANQKPENYWNLKCLFPRLFQYEHKLLRTRSNFLLQCEATIWYHFLVFILITEQILSKFIYLFLVSVSWSEAFFVSLLTKKKSKRF